MRRAGLFLLALMTTGFTTRTGHCQPPQYCQKPPEARNAAPLSNPLPTPVGEGFFLVTGFAQIGDQPFVTLFSPSSGERIGLCFQPDPQGNKLLEISSEGTQLDRIHGKAWVQGKEVAFGGVHSYDGSASSPPPPPPPPPPAPVTPPGPPTLSFPKVVVLSDFSEIPARKQGFEKGFQAACEALPVILGSPKEWLHLLIDRPETPTAAEQRAFLLSNPLPPETTLEEFQLALKGLLKKPSGHIAPKLHLLTSSRNSVEILPSNSYSLEYQKGKGMVSVNSEAAFYEGYTQGWQTALKDGLPSETCPLP